jgi:membrane peptidoglycan carboxypeptidase
MITPALAVTSLTAKSSIGVFENLPDFIQIGGQSQQNQIYANGADGKPQLIASVYESNRQNLSWDQVSPYLKYAAVDGEDRRFYDHGGVDLPSVVRALVKNNTEASDGQSGSSTLDMQLVRNILTNQALELPTEAERQKAYEAATVQTVPRKLKEMKLAIGLDKRYSKKQILLAYLNIVGMGSNTYGVQAGAQQYFSVDAKDVTIAQAASLIAIVQLPSRQNLSSPTMYAANKVRRDEILAAMLDAKHITKAEYTTAVNTPIASEVKLNSAGSGCSHTVPIGAAWACDYVVKLITQTGMPDGYIGAPPPVTALGNTVAQRIANWKTGGYKIYTSLNLSMQAAADAAMPVQAPATETRAPLGAAADSVEVGTGRILVMSQNKQFSDSPLPIGSPTDPTSLAYRPVTAVNFSTDYWWGGSGGFPTGSSFKIFDLANWLQTGHGLSELVDGTGPQTYNFASFKGSCLAGGASGGGTFKLQNDGNSDGSIMSAETALIGSVNNAFMHMAEESDLCDIAATAEAMGAHRADGSVSIGGAGRTDPNVAPGTLQVLPNMILGSNEQAPLTIAAAAATIGAGGVYCKPTMIDDVVGPNGAHLGGQAKTCSQAITAEVAAGVADAMQGSYTSGTSSPANLHDGVPYAGKTGTGNTADHVWLNATSTKVETTVWTGDIFGHNNLRQLTNPNTHQIYASSSRFAIWKAIMAVADATPSLRGGAFPAADAAMIGGANALQVPDVSKQSAEQANSVLTSLGFQTTLGSTEASGLPVGQVTRTDPPAGTQLPKGATITLYTSDGTLATQMPNVIGMSLHDANTAIAAKFTSTPSVTYVLDPTVGTPNLCKVKSSDPAAGAAASKTDPVSLVVYSDKPTPMAPTVACTP